MLFVVSLTRSETSDLQLEIQKGDNMLIMGPSSSGKSSILRVLRGLWPVERGLVAHDFPPGPKTVLFLPQKPILTNGSLLEQVRAIQPTFWPDKALQIENQDKFYIILYKLS